MKKVIFLFAVAFAVLSCSKGQDAQSSSGTETSVQDEEEKKAVAEDLAVDAFKAQVEAAEGAVVLDVRTPEEFTAGHLIDAEHINFYAEDFVEQVQGKVEQGTAIYIYCAAGGRSSSAMEKLAAAGYTELYNMLGGYNAWSSAGYPTEK